MNSNLRLHSNVYPVGKRFNEDDFKSQIRGAAALRKLVGYLSGVSPDAVSDDLAEKYLTSLQMEEFHKAKPCALDPSGDASWGVESREGELMLTCKCENLACRLFDSCRPDYHPDNRAHVLSVEDTKQERKTPVSGDFTDYLPDAPTLLASREISVHISFGDEPTELSLPRLQHSEEKYDRDSQGEVEPERYKDPLLSLLFSPDNLKGQDIVISGNPEKKMLVTAGPGSGKTHSLIEKLKHLSTEHNLSAGSIMVLCFTRAAVREIRERARKETTDSGKELRWLYIRTFDSFATDLLVQRGVEVSGLDYDERIHKAADMLKADPSLLEQVSHLFVDEIQDLVGVRAKLVQAMLGSPGFGFTLLGDPLQGIYDYQVRESGDISSLCFLKWLLNEVDDLSIVNLDKNHRQKAELAAASDRMRELLEEGGETSVYRFISAINNAKSIDEIKNLPGYLAGIRGGRTAILCRTNGLALYVSDLLDKRGIAHELRINNSPKPTPKWIADFFSDSLSANTGSLKNLNQLSKRIPEDTFHDSLDLLAGFLMKNDFTISDLLQELRKGRRLPEDLYIIGSHNLYVTTIHQSKGREFDNVIFVREWSSRQCYEDLFEEAKVYYVAITRAREEVEAADKGFVFLRKNGNRWYKFRTQHGKEKISSIQIGLPGDINRESFVDKDIHDAVSATQQYIQEKIRPGDELILKRDNEKASVYDIFHETRLIGLTSPGFMEAVRSIYRVSGPEYCPTEFQDVFVDCVHSVVVPPETLGHNIPSPWGENGVWHAIHVKGLCVPVSWKFKKHLGGKND